MNKYIVYFQNNINIQVEAINVEAAKIAAFTRMAMAIGDKINVLSIEKIEQIIVVYTKDGQGGYKFHNESVDIVNHSGVDINIAGGIQGYYEQMDLLQHKCSSKELTEDEVFIIKEYVMEKYKDED